RTPNALQKPGRGLEQKCRQHQVALRLQLFDWLLLICRHQGNGVGGIVPQVVVIETGEEENDISHTGDSQVEGLLQYGAPFPVADVLEKDPYFVNTRSEIVFNPLWPLCPVGRVRFPNLEFV